jgi:DNA-binding IscR family transcriptional regulator
VRVTSKATAGNWAGIRWRRPADTIMVGDLIRAIDGPLAPVRCASNSAYEPCADCIDPEHCAVRALMRETREALSGVLDRHSLLTLSQRTDAEPRQRPSTGDKP